MTLKAVILEFYLRQISNHYWISDSCLNKRLDTSIFGIVITTQDTHPSLLDSKYVTTTIWILDKSGFPMVTRCLVLKCFNFWTSSKNRTEKNLLCHIFGLFGCLKTRLVILFFTFPSIRCLESNSEIVTVLTIP